MKPRVIRLVVVVSIAALVLVGMASWLGSAVTVNDRGRSAAVVRAEAYLAGRDDTGVRAGPGLTRLWVDVSGVCWEVATDGQSRVGVVREVPSVACADPELRRAE